MPFSASLKFCFMIMSDYHPRSKSCTYFRFYFSLLHHFDEKCRNDSAPVVLFSHVISKSR